jgi:glutamine cyclotransferase
MTTGGSFLHRRDPRTFAVLESLQITDGGSALFQVNELACVGEHVYGNVYLTDRIVRIDKATGQVIGEVDGSSLVPPRGRPRAVDAVLNGIAHDPESGLFYLTGKLWPVVFEVRFVPE